jgi:hypothetical protein
MLPRSLWLFFLGSFKMIQRMSTAFSLSLSPFFPHTALFLFLCFLHFSPSFPYVSEYFLFSLFVIVQTVNLRTSGLRKIFFFLQSTTIQPVQGPLSLKSFQPQKLSTGSKTTCYDTEQAVLQHKKQRQRKITLQTFPADFEGCCRVSPMIGAASSVSCICNNVTCRCDCAVRSSFVTSD